MKKLFIFIFFLFSMIEVEIYFMKNIYFIFMFEIYFHASLVLGDEVCVKNCIYVFYF